MCLERPLTAKYAATDSAPLTVMPLDLSTNSCSLLILLSFSALQTVIVPFVVEPAHHRDCAFVHQPVASQTVQQEGTWSRELQLHTNEFHCMTTCREASRTVHKGRAQWSPNGVSSNFGQTYDKLVSEAVTAK